MEMTLTKDLSASFALLAGSNQSVSPQSGSGVNLSKADQRSDKFSQKLSAAMEEKTSVDVTAKKNVVKTKDTDTQEEPIDASTTGLPIGLTTNVANALSPVSDTATSQDAVLSTSGSNTSTTGNAGQNTSGIANAILESAAQTFSAQTVLVQPISPVMGSALQQEPLSPIDQRATLSQDAATTTQLATNPTVDSKLMNSSKQGGTAMPSQQIAVTVTNNAVASAVLNSMQEPMKEPVGVSAAANGEKAPETPVIKLDATPAVTEPFSVAVPVTVKTPDQAITANRPVANSIEALLQQDLVSLQVSSVTPTNPTLTKAPQVNITQNSATTNDSTADAKSEAAAGATEEVVITAVEPMQEETGLPEKTLGHSEKDPLVKTANKSELNVMAPTLFNSVLKSVDPVQVAATATASPRQELHDVARQVLNGMSLSTDQLKSSQVIITLKPEHLGEVTVKINVDGDKVTAAFHAASSEVRAILESSLPQLRQEMSHQGWKFDSDGVYGGMKEPFSNQQQQQQPTPEQQIPLFTNRVQRDVYNDVGDFTVSARTQVMSSAAVDYRI